MTLAYSSRKKMMRENFANFDGTTLSRSEIVKHLESQGYEKFYFKTIATSSGLYGVNGAIVHVISDVTETPQTVASFSILSRNTTLLEFI